MGPGDSLHRTKPPCFLDAQQDHPEGHRELQNHARAEGISADIEDKIIMTQDTSTYYVWIGGSCDYGLGERDMRDSVLWRKQSRIIMMKLNNTKSEWFM